MTPRRNQPEFDSKVEGNAETPMDRFKLLARKLLGIRRDEIEEERRKYKADKERRTPT
jgi:hypothetical protein